MHRAIAVLSGIILLLDVAVLAGGSSGLAGASIGPANPPAGLLEGSSPGQTSSPTIAPSLHPTPSPAASPSPTPSASATGESTPPPNTSTGSSPSSTTTPSEDDDTPADLSPSPPPAPERPKPTVAISIELDSAQSSAGNPARYGFRVDVGEDEPGTLTVNFGNGAVHEFAKSDCVVSTTERACFLQHSYRVGGTYTIRAAWCWSCSWDRSWGYAEATVSSANGPYLGNGNYQPYSERTFSATSDPKRLELKLTAKDADGCVTKVEVDWGDGTTPTTMTNSATCRAPGPDAFAWSRWDIPRFGHNYPAEDDYQVTITTWSTAPGGGETQSSVQTKNVTIPYENQDLPSVG